MSFYLYEYFIVDTLEVFYVGKGTGRRRFELHNRSKYFMNIYNKYRCEVRLVKQSLTNEQACEAEKDRIAELRVIGQAKCNFTNGGTGFATGTLNPMSLNPPKGKKNPMYGKATYGFQGKKHTKKSLEKMSNNRKGKGGQPGELNGMFGKGHLTAGENNGMYGRTGFDHPHSKMYRVEYNDGNTETLRYKECEKKFGIAFSRIYIEGGILQYKKKTNKSIYEGVKITRLK